ncbi:hypothetical protein BE61_14930 [Bradyrhizobium elkanii USDA 61]|nr:hypothetical protein BE61_14930 [Bradyrhizobium elkanii USDA 61]
MRRDRSGRSGRRRGSQKPGTACGAASAAALGGRAGADGAAGAEGVAGAACAGAVFAAGGCAAGVCPIAGPARASKAAAIMPAARRRWRERTAKGWTEGFGITGNFRKLNGL